MNHLEKIKGDTKRFQDRFSINLYVSQKVSISNVLNQTNKEKVHFIHINIICLTSLLGSYPGFICNTMSWLAKRNSSSEIHYYIQSDTLQIKANF